MIVRFINKYYLLYCMKTRVDVRSNKWLAILLTVLAVIFVGFVLLPLSLSMFSTETGNVALIPIAGPITGNGGSYLGESTASAKTIVSFIEAAEENKNIKVILLEINSPGGSAVASDEIATAVKKVEKPVVALIREVGASGGYWIASASDYVIANRMSITGSIGVISSYVEFSELMDKYGINYQRMVAGDKKDLGSPLRKLSSDEEELLQKKINRIHDFFIEEIALNRGLSVSKVRELATGEFYLGIEALDLGLVDLLGNKDTIEDYIQTEYNIEEVNYFVYQEKADLFSALFGVFEKMSFNIGEGIGAIFVKSSKNNLMLI
jgi:protease IV